VRVSAQRALRSLGIRKASGALAVGAMCMALWAGLLATGTVSPKPTRTISQEFVAASEWIDDSRARTGDLPTPEAFRRFLLKTTAVVPLDYQPMARGTYTLEGWDGNNRWRFSSDSQNIVRAE